MDPKEKDDLELGQEKEEELCIKDLWIVVISQKEMLQEWKEYISVEAGKSDHSISQPSKEMWNLLVKI